MWVIGSWRIEFVACLVSGEVRVPGGGCRLRGREERTINNCVRFGLGLMAD